MASSDIAHELRTPINHILGYSEVLLDELVDSDTPESIFQDLKRIHEEGMHVLAIVNAMFGPIKSEEDWRFGPVKRLCAIDALCAGLSPRVPEPVVRDLEKIAGAVRSLAFQLNAEDFLGARDGSSRIGGGPIRSAIPVRPDRPFFAVGSGCVREGVCG